jgi:hypothetical protein
MTTMQDVINSQQAGVQGLSADPLDGLASDGTAADLLLAAGEQPLGRQVVPDFNQLQQQAILLGVEAGRLEQAQGFALPLPLFSVPLAALPFLAMPAIPAAAPLPSTLLAATASGAQLADFAALAADAAIEVPDTHGGELPALDLVGLGAKGAIDAGLFQPASLEALPQDGVPLLQSIPLEIGAGVARQAPPRSEWQDVNASYGLMPKCMSCTAHVHTGLLAASALPLETPFGA